jgi:hypothetical protein
MFFQWNDRTCAKMGLLRYSNFNILLLFLTCIPQSFSTQCYRPDGSEPDSDYQPCHTGGHSMCCATNRVASVNKCRPDDLCFQEDLQEVWRESCTDPTWKDPACLHLCVDGISKSWPSYLFVYRAMSFNFCLQ